MKTFLLKLTIYKMTPPPPLQSPVYILAVVCAPAESPVCLFSISLRLRGRDDILTIARKMADIDN